MCNSEIGSINKAASDRGLHWGNLFLTRERGFPITYPSLLRGVCPRVSAGSGRTAMVQTVALSTHCHRRAFQTVPSPQSGAKGTEISVHVNWSASVAYPWPTGYGRIISMLYMSAHLEEACDPGFAVKEKDLVRVDPAFS